MRTHRRQGAAMFVALAFGSVGCITSTEAIVRTDDGPLGQDAATSPASVELYAMTPSRAFDVLGTVVAAADGQDDAGDAVALLKETAAKIGAHAVIETRLEGEYGNTEGAVKLTGIAVRWR
jgi:hypothetical protein